MCPHSKLAWPALALVAAANVAPARLPAQRPPDTVHVAMFSVAWPNGKGWKVRVDSAASRVDFQHRRSFAFQPVQLTEIMVFANRLIVDTATLGLPDSAIARGYLDNEVRLLQEDAAANGYKQAETARLVDSIAGRRLYVLKFKSQRAFLGMGGQAVEGLLYLWFPPDFPVSHSFFCFQITEGYKRGNLGVSVDLTQITPVIQSFRPKASATAVRETPGTGRPDLVSRPVDQDLRVLHTFPGQRQSLRRGPLT